MHFISTIIWSKKDFEEMVAPSAGLYSKRRYVSMRAQSTFSADFSGKPLDYYRNLRVTNPSNYSLLL